MKTTTNMQQVTDALNHALDSVADAALAAMHGVADTAQRDIQREAEAIERHVVVLLGTVARLAHTQKADTKAEETQTVAKAPSPASTPATAPAPASTQKPFATLYAEWVRENLMDELNGAGITLEAEVANQIYGMLEDPQSERVSVWAQRDDPRMLPLIEHLGGLDYCNAVFEWKLEMRKVSDFNQRRKPENRKPYPSAPALPAGGVQ